MLNRRERLLQQLTAWTEDERLTVLAQRAICRRRLDRLGWRWRRARWRLRVDERQRAWRVDPEMGEMGENRESFAFAFEDRRLPGRKAAERLHAQFSRGRRRVSVPPWPVPPKPLTPRVRRLFNRWRAQWERLRQSRLWRCEHPKCAVVGGRYFIARTSDRDCRYCRRSTTKVTRWRNRARQKFRLKGSLVS